MVMTPDMFYVQIMPDDFVCSSTDFENDSD